MNESIKCASINKLGRSSRARRILLLTAVIPFSFPPSHDLFLAFRGLHATTHGLHHVPTALVNSIQARASEPWTDVRAGAQSCGLCLGH